MGKFNYILYGIGICFLTILISCKDELEEVNDEDVKVEACIEIHGADTVFYGNEITLSACSSSGLKYNWTLNDSLISEDQSVSFRTNWAVETYEIVLTVDSLGYTGSEELTIEPVGLGNIDTKVIPSRTDSSYVFSLRQVFKTSDNEYLIDYTEYNYEKDGYDRMLLKLDTDLNVSYNIFNNQYDINNGKMNFVELADGNILFSKIDYTSVNRNTSIFEFDQSNLTLNYVTNRSNRIYLDSDRDEDFIYFAGAVFLSDNEVRSVVYQTDLNGNSVNFQDQILEEETSVIYSVENFDNYLLALVHTISNKIYLCKIDKNLTVEWKKEIDSNEFSSTSFDIAYYGRNWKIERISDNRFIVFTLPIVSIVDAQGEVLFSKNYSIYSSDFIPNDIVRIDDGFIFLQEESVVKIDENGEMIWRNDNVHHSITDIEKYDDEYILFGIQSTGADNSSNKIQIFKLDEDGNVRNFHD